MRNGPHPLAGFDQSVAALRLRLLKAVGHPEEARTAAALALEHTADHSRDFEVDLLLSFSA